MTWLLARCPSCLQPGIVLWEAVLQHGMKPCRRFQCENEGKPLVLVADRKAA